ncbi:MAG: uroporphyrinogen-III synthase [Owenweeksia sp.]
MSDHKNTALIYSTRSLNADLVEKIEEAGLSFEQADFIDIDYDFNEETFYNRLNNPASQARVFTSKNAFFSLQKLAQSRTVDLQPKRNFTVGVRTTEMLEDFGIKPDARAGNAISLAQIIARNKDVKAIDFFCGNQSLDDLPEYLESKGIHVHREIVYKTQLVHHKVNTENIKGIIFLSPTAVFSFFKNNSLLPDTPCFCIGATTSEAVHLRCNNRRILAYEPSIASVVDRLIDYFIYDKY